VISAVLPASTLLRVLAMRIRSAFLLGATCTGATFCARLRKEAGRRQCARREENNRLSHEHLLFRNRPFSVNLFEIVAEIVI
jgi:hypothetical protein